MRDEIVQEPPILQEGAVKVGKYTITKLDERNVWIQSASEGGSFPIREFEAAIEKFFNRNF